MGGREEIDDYIDDYIDAAARLLRLPLDQASVPAVRANLATILAFADLVDDGSLADEAEPAPVFRA